VVAASPDLLASLWPDKLLPSTDQVPERFELGTLPYELLAGTAAAVRFLAEIGGMIAIEAHEARLRSRLEDGLAGLDGVTIHSRAAVRTPTVLLTFAGRDPADAYRFLAARGVNAPAGSFYAIEPSRWLGLGDTGGLRAGLAPYSDEDDVDRLLEGLQAFLAA
jgi:selenocysteine lyase/cysteine desulfurase